MGSPTLLDRFKFWLSDLKVWLSRRLGNHYAAAITILDRAALVFGGTFVSRFMADGFHQVRDVGYLETCAMAGLAAVVAMVQGLITTATTGSPALASFASRTLRARRDNGYRVQHQVPIRPTRKATR